MERQIKKVRRACGFTSAITIGLYLVTLLIETDATILIIRILLGLISMMIFAIRVGADLVGKERKITFSTMMTELSLLTVIINLIFLVN